MNITPSNGTFSDNSLQGTYVKQTQAASEIAASEHNKPQQVNAVAEASIDRKVSEKKVSAIQLSQPSADIPAEVPINAPVSASLARSLTNEFNKFPDIDHAKVAELMSQLNSSKLAVDSDELASSMLNFYQGGS